MRGGESKSDPMEDKRGGVEEKENDEVKQGGEGTGRQAKVLSIVCEKDIIPTNNVAR